MGHVLQVVGLLVGGIAGSGLSGLPTGGIAWQVGLPVVGLRVAGLRVEDCVCVVGCTKKLNSESGLLGIANRQGLWAEK